jgi:hypothetical protein
MPTASPESSADVRVDVGLVKIDALVLQKSTARIVGSLNKEDFLASLPPASARCGWSIKRREFYIFTDEHVAGV